MKASTLYLWEAYRSHSIPERSTAFTWSQKYYTPMFPVFQNMYATIPTQSWAYTNHPEPWSLFKIWAVRIQREKSRIKIVKIIDYDHNFKATEQNLVICFHDLAQLNS